MGGSRRVVKNQISIFGSKKAKNGLKWLKNGQKKHIKFCSRKKHQPCLVIDQTFYEFFFDTLS